MSLTTESTEVTERETLTTIYRWIERSHPDGFVDSLTFSQNLERVGDRWYDRLDRLERERDEAREAFVIATDQMVRAQCNLRDSCREAGEAIFARDEAREENKKLKEALIRVRTWGVSSKNFDASDSYQMAEWIDDGCEGELPKPDGPWIYERLEAAK